MYSGHGSAEFTNTARAVLCIEPTEDANVFQFIAAKRGALRRLAEGQYGKVLTLLQALDPTDRCSGEPADADDIAAALEPPVAGKRTCLP